MAHFYGRLAGSRGPATRCGTKSSGIEVTAETWSSVIRACQYHVESYTPYVNANADGTPAGEPTPAKDMAAIQLHGKHGGNVFHVNINADAIVQHADHRLVKAALQRAERELVKASDYAENITARRDGKSMNR